MVILIVILIIYANLPNTLTYKLHTKEQQTEAEKYQRN